jgi:hypothetical protein
MAEIKIIKGILLDTDRAFLPSKNINIFPCSRRGQYETEASVKHYDPEARLNTERTNRLRTSINGFKDSFIDSFTKDKDKHGNELDAGTLVFALAGYRIEIKEFNPADIATALGITDGTIYAHLSLYTKAELSTAGYYTEILYRQTGVKTDVNYLDVAYTYNGTTEDFFVGVSFTKEELEDGDLPPYNLPLFSYVDTSWKLVQTSLLPKIEHGNTDDSIIVLGDAEFNKNITVQETATITTVKVPYEVEGQPAGDTIITTGGIDTPYIYAKALAADGITADGITVGGEISIVDDLDPEKVSKQTTIGHTNITTTNVTATGNITAHTTLNVTKAEGTSDPAVATIDKAVIDDVEINKSLTVGTDKFSVTDTVADFNVPVTVTNNVTIDDEHCYIKTPTLDVKSIENNKDSTGVNINDNLNVATGHAAAVDTVNVNTINSRQENGTITVESPVTLNGNTTLNKTLEVIGKATLDNGLEVTNGESSLQKLSAKETKLESLAIAGEAASGSALTVNGKTTVNNDLEVTGTTSTPTLKVDTITTNANSEITVDSLLKVTGKATLNNGLQVTTGDTDLQKLITTELAVATDALTVTKDEAKFIKPVTVDSSLTANNVQIKNQGQVPALELYHFKNGPYQLRFKFNTAPTIIEEK